MKTLAPRHSVRYVGHVVTARDSLGAFEEWLKATQSLRQALLDERATLVHRVEQIDKALAKLPAEQSAGGAEADSAARRGRVLGLAVSEIEKQFGREAIDKMKARMATHPRIMLGGTPQLVREIIAEHPGSSAPQILEHMRRMGVSLRPVSVHSAIHRLVKANQLRCEGQRGKQRYFVEQIPIGLKIKEWVPDDVERTEVDEEL